ncbi:BTB/POZ fold [Artemisia annua]|uniref:BTB/POZ fold n=1 Tax=Artemisia annua TaxID=35608 RepID=A0A2U1Q7G8_ARTAN|nr:BTB/POZ fold [Artemisia annua]
MENDNPNNNTSDRIKLNVGGKLFETTISTLQSGGPDSLLSTLSTRHVSTTSPFNNASLDSLSSALSTRHISSTSPFSNNNNFNNNTQDRGPIFIDRDPEIFTILLSLLRTNRLPKNRFSVTELTEEAEFYGIESVLLHALKPNRFSGIDASIVKVINPASDGLVTDFHVVSDGAVFIAHGGQVTVYDSNLSYVQTVRTHLDEIGSVRRVARGESGAREVVAVGSEDVAGVSFYDMVNGRGVGSVEWRDESDPRIYKARVRAISDSEEEVFVSCESYHRENCVLVVDKETLGVKGEIGRQSGSSAKFGVPRGLSYVEEMGVLVGMSVTSGAFGYSGYVRLWDVRSGRVVWETNEPGSGRSSRFGDSFADVSVDVNDMSMCKICSKSGDLGIADLRKLGDDPWVYLRDTNPSLRDTSGGVSNSVVHCYKKQVFVGRDGGLEVWSRVAEKGGSSEIGEESFRRNYMDKVEDSERGIIKKIEGGGERLFVSREGAEGLEVWESSVFSGAVLVP